LAAARFAAGLAAGFAAAFLADLVSVLGSADFLSVFVFGLSGLASDVALLVVFGLAAALSFADVSACASWIVAED
jgi:hypothetical protein